MRPTRNEVLMQMAELIAQRGTCDRKQVGAVIALDGRPLSMGFNGAPPGLPHCDENDHGWDNSWEIASLPEANRDEAIYLTKERLEVQGCRNATHAEANALAFAAKHGISTDRSQLFVTVAPCDTCARLLISAGISAVYFKEEYRDGSGVELLERIGIAVHQRLQGHHSNWSDG